MHGIETLVPDSTYDQKAISETMQALSPEPSRKRLIRALYRASGIDKRHSVISNLSDGDDPFLSFDDQGKVIEPGTAKRNALYSQHSREMAPKLGKQLLASTDFAPEEITHVITVSCTGFYNPGPDFHLVRELGLSPHTQRYNLGFMGCYAAFPALSMARQFCQADKKAVVLVLCLELCSLHLNLRDSEDNLLGNALFADGAAATLISARSPKPGRAHLKLDGFSSDLLPEGEQSMAWTLGDLGFEIALSSYVPQIIGTRIEAVLDGVLARQNMDRSKIERWAIHPGGRAIVDKIEQSLGLLPEHTTASREILRQYGNMSSATILFVLKAMLEEDAGNRPGQRLCAMAFGPGLSVESALMTLE